MDGEGDTYRAAKRRCVECPICHAQLQERSLPRHIHTRHGDIHRPYKRRRLLEDSTRPSVYYFVYSPWYRSPLDCPVPGCPGTASTWDAMRNHFCHRHWRDVVHILRESFLPRCPRCSMQVRMTRQHMDSQRCQIGRERKRKQELELSHLRALDKEFRVTGTRLENVETFSYLGRVVTATGEDWPAVSRNLRNARKKWGQFSSLLKREGASSRVSGLFYKAVVMSTLLYSCETWVLT